jgi:hypothetical protein
VTHRVKHSVLVTSRAANLGQIHSEWDGSCTGSCEGCVAAMVHSKYYFILLLFYCIILFYLSFITYYYYYY